MDSAVLLIELILILQCFFAFRVASTIVDWQPQQIHIAFGGISFIHLFDIMIDGITLTPRYHFMQKMLTKSSLHGRP